MDREAQEGNSSSRNVKLEVTDIRRGAGNAVECSFSDGSSFFLHASAATDFYLRIGSELDQGRLEELLLCSARFAARDKAVEYLARREHSAGELVLKLMKKGYDRVTASDAVELLKQRGYVDDSRFARMWIESRLRRRPEGRSKLLAGLAAKGVARETAEAAVAGVFTAEEAEDALRRCAVKYIKTRKPSRQKLVNYLMGRGFSYGEITGTLQAMEEDPGEDYEY